MTMTNRDTFLEYLKTFFLTLFITFVLVLVLLGIIQNQVYNELSEKKAQDEVIDYYLIGVMIEKNKYLENKDPDNYTINLKLGTLYQAEKDYKNAELQYKKSIGKAPYPEFKPNYKLALLYINQNRLEDAQMVMDKIYEIPNKKLIKYKAEIYAKLGDKYYEKADYANAALRYQKSLNYYRIIKSKAGVAMEGNMASAYVYLAEQKVSEMQIEDAINYLELANSIIDAPIIKYKLAILLEKQDPELAYTYFEQVFKTTPELINHKEYYNFLMELANKATLENNFGQAALYEYKAKRLDEYFKTNILSVEDISVEMAEGKMLLNRWTNKYNAILKIKIKNSSKEDLNSLYLDVIFKDNLKTIDEYKQQIASDEYKLYSEIESPIISIKTKVDHDQKDPHPRTITAEVYVSKTENSCKLYLTTLTIKEEIKETMFGRMFRMFGELFNKITSKLPSFLF